MKYADTANNLKESELGMLLKLADMPEYYNFASGYPAQELFPLQELEAVDRAILRKEGRLAVQYGSSKGYLPLRQQIAQRMKTAFFAECRAEDILITSGSQQGLSMLGQLFLNPNDVVLVESPTYLGAINAFRTNAPKFIEVPTDHEGILPAELETILAREQRVRMIYVIPTFQNPSGVTWTMERRQAFMDIVSKYDIPVLEDNPYGELRYDGQALPSLKSMDRTGNVVFLGSFSKILMPGLRVGWIAANPEILRKLELLKQLVDLQTSSFAQRQISYFMDQFDLDAHIERMKTVYKRRRDLMCDAIRQSFPANVSFTHPEGGLFVWVTLPEGTDAKQLMEKAMEQKVAYVPAASFYPNGGNENHFRLNFSTMNEARIEEGIRALAKVLKAQLPASPLPHPDAQHG